MNTNLDNELQDLFTNPPTFPKFEMQSFNLVDTIDYLSSTKYVKRIVFNLKISSHDTLQQFYSWYAIARRKLYEFEYLNEADITLIKVELERSKHLKTQYEKLVPQLIDTLYERMSACDYLEKMIDDRSFEIDCNDNGDGGQSVTINNQSYLTSDNCFIDVLKELHESQMQSTVEMINCFHKFLYNLKLQAEIIVDFRNSYEREIFELYQENLSNLN